MSFVALADLCSYSTVPTSDLVMTWTQNSVVAPFTSVWLAALDEPDGPGRVIYFSALNNLTRHCRQSQLVLTVWTNHHRRQSRAMKRWTQRWEPTTTKQCPCCYNLNYHCRIMAHIIGHTANHMSCAKMPKDSELPSISHDDPVLGEFYYNWYQRWMPYQELLVDVQSWGLTRTESEDRAAPCGNIHHRDGTNFARGPLASVHATIGNPTAVVVGAQ